MSALKGRPNNNMAILSNSYDDELKSLNGVLRNQAKADKEAAAAKLKPSQDLAAKIQSTISNRWKQAQTMGTARGQIPTVTVRPDGTVIVQDSSGKILAQGKDAKAFSGYI